MRKYYFLITTCFLLFNHMGSSQTVLNEPSENIEEEKTECLSAEKRNEIKFQIRDNISKLVNQGKLDTNFISRSSSIVLFDWPLRQAAAFSDPSYYSVTNYVDHDVTTGNANFNQFGSTNEDYDCGLRTYDTNTGYNHLGIDIGIQPFSWYKMDNNAVEVIAAKNGTIITKDDGHFDMNCSCVSNDWNGITILHTDGSIAIYGHMKNGSLTNKTVGQTVSTGEYLGVVGSSGCSTGPHLHFEVYESNNFTNLIDPYGGPCNSKNGSTSWWNNQKPHEEPFIKKIMTSKVIQQASGCPNQELYNPSNIFNQCDLLYSSLFLRDYEYGTTIIAVVKDANGNTIATNPINYSNPNSNLNFAPNFTWYWSINIPCNAIGGQWTLECTYKGQSVTHNFTVGTCADGIQNGGETGVDCGGSLCPSCCPANLSVNNIPIQNGIYIADNILDSHGDITPNSSVEFKAGNCILLNDGFNANGYFEASIEGCPQ